MDITKESAFLLTGDSPEVIITVLPTMPRYSAQEFRLTLQKDPDWSLGYKAEALGIMRSLGWLVGKFATRTLN